MTDAFCHKINRLYGRDVSFSDSIRVISRNMAANEASRPSAKIRMGRQKIDTNSSSFRVVGSWTNCQKQPDDR